MNPVLDTIRTALGAGPPWLIPTIAGAVIAVGIFGLILAVRYVRNHDGGVKEIIGTGAVQTLVAFIIVTGVYAYCADVLDMPPFEAGISSVGIIACIWAGAGRVISHGKKTGTVGWGPAGPFFWGAVTIGGLLAVLGSDSLAVAGGRAGLVILDAWLWSLQLGHFTRPNPDNRWKWTPRRFLIAIGARAAADDDNFEDARQVRIARIATAMRRSNSFWPFSWWGSRTLDRLGDKTAEDIVAEAIRRRASSRVLVTQAKTKSAVMLAAVDAVMEAQTAAILAPPPPPAIESKVNSVRRVRQEPPVEEWQRDADPAAPVSPAVGGSGLTREQQIAKWRVDYAEAVAHVKSIWKEDRTGLYWRAAGDPPSSNAIVTIMKASGIGKWTSKETCLKIQAVIIDDRRVAADEDTGADELV